MGYNRLESNVDVLGISSNPKKKKTSEDRHCHYLEYHQSQHYRRDRNTASFTFVRAKVSRFLETFIDTIRQYNQQGGLPYMSTAGVSQHSCSMSVEFPSQGWI